MEKITLLNTVILNPSHSPLFGVIILVNFPTYCKHHLLTALGTVTLYKKPPWRIIVIHILSIFPSQFLCCTSFPPLPFIATFSIYIILWLLHKFSNICEPEEGWYGQPKYCYKKQYTLFWISFAVVFGLLVLGTLYKQYVSVATFWVMLCNF